jgi:uncharacterized protein GlcG (DUF336 family)
MMNLFRERETKTYIIGVFLACVLALSAVETWADSESSACSGLPDHASLQAALESVVTAGGNGGFGNDMWATLVNRDGIVCAIAFTGDDRDDQWPGSRVISAQKANTANAFSLEGAYPNVGGVGRALSSGNLYGLVLPGGSLFGLQFSNPVSPAAAYDGNSSKYGRPNDPMVGSKIGGVNVFGGGLAAYDVSPKLIGALGVSGDTACTDHIIAWRVRDALGIDNIPGGVGDGFTTDNLILNNPPTPNSFDHPSCGFGEDSIIADLNTNFPTGP